MKILIIGPGGCGKDTFAHFLSKHSKLKFDPDLCSTSRAILYGYFEPVIRESKNWDSEEQIQQALEEFYRNRRNNRQKWFDAGDILRRYDKMALLRWCFAHGDIATGVRTRSEIEEAKRQKVLDMVIWVDRPDHEESNTFELSMADANVCIPNRGSLKDLEDNARRLSTYMTATGWI